MEEKIKIVKEMIQQAETKYYVAKLFKHSTPSIVEEFTDETFAHNYAGLMTSAEKGVFVVLTVHQPIERSDNLPM